MDVGEIVARRYVLEQMLGAGGMGAVYRAYDRELDEHVALKLLHSSRARSAEWLELFKAEVKLARRVTHRNVARTFELGDHGGRRFLTMELVHGESLKNILARRARLSVEETITIASSIASGLEAAHAAGVVHRDIKPDNVLIEENGRVVITDFGVALAMLGPKPDTSSSPLILGTPAYMAPEQIDSKEISARADLFALGVLIYEALSGRAPWHRDTPLATLSARITARALEVSDFDPSIPESLVALVLDCMKHDPAERPASAAEVRRRLDPRAREVHSVNSAPARKAETPSIAVLPLRASAEEEVAQIFTEDLIDALCTVRGLRVKSMSSVRATTEETSVIERGRAVGASIVVDGSLRVKEDQARLGVRLVRVSDGDLQWAEHFECAVAEVLGLVNLVAPAIARALALESQAPARELPADPALLELYLRARRAYHQMSTENMELAAKLFERALERAPKSAVITAWLAMTRIRAWFLASNPAPSVARLARETAENAVVLSPDAGEPHLALGLAHLHAAEPAKAAREMRLAIARSPSLPEAQDFLGRLLAEAGRIPDGFARMRVAIDLDREMSATHWEIARTQALLSEWKEALALVAELSSTHHARPGLAARIFTWRNDVRALEELDAQLDRQSSAPSSVLARGITDLWLGRVTAKEHYQKLEASLPGLSGSSRRMCLLLQVKAEHASKMGDLEVAIDALRRADDYGLLDLVWLMRCPLLEPIRGHVEYARVRQQVEKRADAVCEAVWG